MISDDEIRVAVAESTDRARRRAATHVFERAHLGRILRILDDTSHWRAVVLLGPRQVGKTTLLCQALAALESAGASVHSCDFTDRILGGAGLRRVVQALGIKGDERPSYVFFDEVHYVDGWERELKILVDERAGRFAVADSAAAVVRAAMRDAGAGRWSMVSVRPLGFVEWLDLRAEHGLPCSDTPRGRSEACIEFLRRGGLPEFVGRQPSLTEAHRVIRADLVEQAIRADVGPVHGIRNVHGLEQMLRWILSESGLQVTYSKATAVVGTKGNTTRSWLGALQDTGLVWLLPTWNESKAKQSRRPAKGYASDPGLVAAFTPGGAREQGPTFVGRLVETACACAVRDFVAPRSGRFGYFERRKGDRVVGEADLVLEVDGTRLLVEATASRRPTKKLGRVARRAAEIKRVDVACIVTPTVPESSVHRSDGREIHILPLHQFLSRLGSGELPV